MYTGAIVRIKKNAPVTKQARQFYYKVVENPANAVPDHSFVWPTTTIKTGKEVSWANQVRYARWVHNEHLQEIDVDVEGTYSLIPVS